VGDELIDASPRKRETFSEIFEEQFPFYLSIGMSSAEYWEGDPSLPRYFRKAFKMRQTYENEQAWLHGLYVYDATISALTHLSKDKKDHREYTSKPYSFDPDDYEEDQEAKVDEAQAQAELWMKSWVAATQRHFSR
jgi:hypothetical protein